MSEGVFTFNSVGTPATPGGGSAKVKLYVKSDGRIYIVAEDGTENKTPSEKHGEGPGTQQAGTSKASNIKGDLKAQEEDIGLGINFEKANTSWGSGYTELIDVFSSEIGRTKNKSNVTSLFSFLYFVANSGVIL